MNKYNFLLLALFVIAFQSCDAQKKQQVASIAFYNLENLFDTENNPLKDDEEFLPDGPYHYTEYIYQQKLHNIATVLKQIGTDVSPDGPVLIGVAEVENARVLQDLAKQPEIRNRNYQPILFEGQDPRGIDVGLLYNPKHFRPIRKRAIPVLLNGARNEAISRDVLYVTGILAGDTVHVFVNHWTSRRNGEAESAPKRAIAAAANRKIIDSLMKANNASHIIVMGDFNDDPVDYSITNVLDAEKNKDDIKQTDLYNPWVQYYKNGEGTSGYNERWNLFDQIILSGSFLQQSGNSWQFHKAEIFKKDFMLQKFGKYKGFPQRSFAGTRWINGYSDHLPVLVYLIKEK